MNDESYCDRVLYLSPARYSAAAAQRIVAELAKGPLHGLRVRREPPPEPGHEWWVDSVPVGAVAGEELASIEGHVRAAIARALPESLD